MAFEMHGQAKVIHEGTRLTLREATFAQSDGGEARREVVEVADAVVVLPLLEDGRMVLIRNERFAVGQTLWELPAGTLEPGEDPPACAGRELTEETGYAAGRLERLCAFYSTPGFCTEQLIAYRALGLRLESRRLDPTERISVELIELPRVLEMIRGNAIRDAKTIATILYHATFAGVGA